MNFPMMPVFAISLQLMVGTVLRSIRKELNYTSEATSEYLGVRLDQYLKIERGFSKLTVMDLIRISDFFGISPDVIPKRVEAFRDHLLEQGEKLTVNYKNNSFDVPTILLSHRSVALKYNKYLKGLKP